jgi:hypothetical protein
MTTQRKKTFKNETVELDGNEFIDCKFQGCQLVYSGGPLPRFDGCAFDASPFNFQKGAGNALHFLRDLYHAGLSQNVEALFDHIRKNPPPGAG